MTDDDLLRRADDLIAYYAQDPVLRRVMNEALESLGTMNKFEIDPRGAQEASWATVIFTDNRIGILINDSTKLWLTQIQTEELAKWILAQIKEQ